ncbi:hypothetical protein SAMN05216496_0768 [Pseudomonas sp. Z003-0.4C(8344-21)]|nr:hypothetical protein SAMN05216496_0768 [Pseudomonas sp. Z003-0.4C(8344-21)]SDT57598.1 hypothetical protein SAMN05216579_4640 [Pseudomonas granadensis]
MVLAATLMSNDDAFVAAPDQSGVPISTLLGENCTRTG